MQTELADKIDRESVGFIVHEKYEEIVRYLQDALQSSLEDENNFKEKADEIQEMVVLLSNSKADRSEIANMQEIMVKSEALLKKVGSQANIKEKMKDMITRKELEAMMSMKVDKVDFEHQLQNALVNGRKARKMQSLSTGLHPIQDEAMALSHSLPNLHHVGINDHHHVLSMSVHDQSPPSSANNLGMPRSGRAGSPPTLQNGVMHIDPPANGPNGNASMQPVPVIAIGQSLGGGSPGRGTRGSSDFSQFVKAKGPKGGKAGNLPSADIPGAFRKATEGNRAGGQLKPTGASPNPEGYGRSEYPYTDPNYNMPYSEQSAMTDHLAYIHGPLVGGGFNARSAHILRSLPGNKTIPGEDVEGKGL